MQNRNKQRLGTVKATDSDSPCLFLSSFLCHPFFPSQPHITNSIETSPSKRHGQIVVLYWFVWGCCPIEMGEVCEGESDKSITGLTATVKGMHLEVAEAEWSNPAEQLCVKSRECCSSIRNRRQCTLSLTLWFDVIEPGDWLFLSIKGLLNQAKLLVGLFSITKVFTHSK